MSEVLKCPDSVQAKKFSFEILYWADLTSFGVKLIDVQAIFFCVEAINKPRFQSGKGLSDRLFEQFFNT